MSIFVNDTATTEIYTLSLHDALPICAAAPAPRRHDLRFGAQVRARLGDDRQPGRARGAAHRPQLRAARRRRDRKSTRLNSSHANISYAVFCLKKKTFGSKTHKAMLNL